jgi:hypothetical protein
MCLGIDEVVAWEEERPFDVQVEITELPYLFRSTLRTLPADVPYLDLPSGILEDMTALLPPCSRSRVGLVWSASHWDKSRSLSLSSVRRLLDTSGLDFWSLQESSHNMEWHDLCLEKGWGRRQSGGNSLVELAAAIACMDLVITVDTLAAHLAGALAKPVWVILKADADWRWMLEREDSPWYPTMRLFRQRMSGDWSDVIDDVASALCGWNEDIAVSPGRFIGAAR